MNMKHKGVSRQHSLLKYTLMNSSSLTDFEMGVD